MFRHRWHQRGSRGIEQPTLPQSAPARLDAGRGPTEAGGVCCDGGVGPWLPSVSCTPSASVLAVGLFSRSRAFLRAHRCTAWATTLHREWPMTTTRRAPRCCTAKSTLPSTKSFTTLPATLQDPRMHAGHSATAELSGPCAVQLPSRFSDGQLWQVSCYMSFLSERVRGQAPDHMTVAHALVADELGRHSAVGAGQDDGGRFLGFACHLQA